MIHIPTAPTRVLERLAWLLGKVAPRCRWLLDIETELLARYIEADLCTTRERGAA